MATKRIYQIAKEFEREEKSIIEFLTAQGIKVGNRLSAVSEDTYNLLKNKFLAPPEPEPVPEPEPEPEPAPVETPAKVEPSSAPTEQAPAQGGKKKKKKKKSPQPDATDSTDEEVSEVELSDVEDIATNQRTSAIAYNAVEAGNEFIKHYDKVGLTKKQLQAIKPHLTMRVDTWDIMQNIPFDYPDSSPLRYWQCVNKLASAAFRLVNNFGMSNRENLAEMRNSMSSVGAAYVPREIFTDEENNLFAEQQKFLFVRFGHGMGAVNDRLFELKRHAELMKTKFEYGNLLDFVTNPACELRCTERVPFAEIADAVTYNIRGIARRFNFYTNQKERIQKIVETFFVWIEGYAKLKEQGADVAKLEKYLSLEKKFIDLVEFMSYKNLLGKKNKTPAPFDTVLELLEEYRDNLDNPDAERNFKYKVRGVTNIIYKPKEFVFLYQLAELEPQKDYRPPEEINE